MPQTQHLALLRGINVGGNNIIKMVDLKKCFEEMDFTKVATYIQSGNVVFTADESNSDTLVPKLEKALSETFGYRALVVVVNRKQLKQVVDEAPADFGKFPDEFKYDVLFVKSPLTAAEAIKNVTPREGVDQCVAGKEVLYFQRLKEKSADSYLDKLLSHAAYKSMTIRNWNTTVKLMGMIEKK